MLVCLCRVCVVFVFVFVLIGYILIVWSQHTDGTAAAAVGIVTEGVDDDPDQIHSATEVPP